MSDLGHFTIQDLVKVGKELRSFAKQTGSMEELADLSVRYIYDEFADHVSGKPQCVLVRFYKTHAFGLLKEKRRTFVKRQEPEIFDPKIKCLTLLATAGTEPEWNDPYQSKGHLAIPLPSEDRIASIPMIAQLIEQFGLDIRGVVSGDQAFMIDQQQRNFNVFYVPVAKGCPYIPAQETFVVPYGVQSVLGLGGLLPSGDMFALILFSGVAIPRETAEMFQTLALSLKVALIPFEGLRIFK